jgi:Flp pilus assembly protein TadB
MFYRAISLVLVAVLVHGSTAAQDQPQSPPQTVAKMQQVLHKAQEKDKAVKVTLKKKIDNQKKFSGKVSDISDTGFVVTDQKTGTTKTLAFEDVQQVNQKGMSKGTKIALGVAGGVVVAVAILAIWAVHHLD